MLICVQSRCQHNRYGRAKPGTRGQGGGKVQQPWERKGMLPPPLPSLFCSNLETVSRLESSGDLFTISVTGTLYLQVSGASSTGDSTGQEGAFRGPSPGLGTRSASQMTSKPQ